MFSKPLSNLTYKDIEDLLFLQNIEEGSHLDFKESIGDIDKGKNVLVKEITAFANSGGGFLIYGISDAKKIVGIEPTIKGRRVVEWINQAVHSNIEPKISYPDPKIIELPDESGKILLVIEIPESISKPHMVNEKNAYFIRMNDGSKPASHYQVRDMFEYANNRANEVKDFMDERNLNDIKSPNFGLNDLSESIKNPNIKILNGRLPLMIISVIPQKLNNNRLTMPFGELKKWIENHQMKYEVFYDPRYENFKPRIDGVIIKRSEGNDDTFRFQILNNGYIEVVFSKQITWEYTDNSNTTLNLIHASSINQYILSLLNFLPSFFDFINYSEEVVLQISFANMKNCVLYDFNQRYRNMEHRYFRDKNGTNLYHNNFQIIRKFHPQNLNPEFDLEVVKTISQDLHRAFGLSEEYCFWEEKLNPQIDFQW